MNIKFRGIIATIFLLLICGFQTACGKSAPIADDTIVLKIEDGEFTYSEILAMMDLTARSYKLTLDDVREDVPIWNALVEGTLFDYAAAEISRDLCTEYGLIAMTDEEMAQVEAFYDAKIESIKRTGEDPEKYLMKLGLDESLLRTCSENQVYKTHLSKYWCS